MRAVNLDEGIRKRGALAEEAAQLLPRLSHGRLPALFGLADDVHALAQEQRESAVKESGPLPWLHPVPLTTLLLARGIRSFEGLYLLCERGCGQDALTLARVICEAQILVHGLKVCPDLTIEHLRADSDQSEHRLHTKFRDLFFLNEEEPPPWNLDHSIAELEAKVKGKRQSTAEIAKLADAAEEYFLFLDFSARAAHPGLQSLTYELSRDPNAPGFRVGPDLDASADALSKSCLVMIGLCFAVAALFDWREHKPRLDELNTRLKAELAERHAMAKVPLRR